MNSIAKIKKKNDITQKQCKKFKKQHWIVVFRIKNAVKNNRR
jgi:hypothetical protein